jgi:hypothetical protein
MYLVRRPAIANRRGRRVRFATMKTARPGWNADGAARQICVVIVTRT